MPIKQQKPVEAHDTLSKNPGAIYLDVRTEGEFAQGHPAGALNVPVVFIKGPGQMEPNDDFAAVVEKIIPKNTKLVVGCLAGGRSQRACEILEGAGYTDLTNVVGGWGGQRDGSGNVIGKGWRDEGLPTSSEVGDAGYQALRTKAGI
ncbi:MAG TPA: rhodanese-like domain-containing protein [Candidatus Binataceae bacterium]|nr:rhodanese-like domain-containing protein [Candidatus Binataceae bacterium]